VSFTTDDLILQVRRRAFLAPVGGPTDDEVLGYINEERRTTMAEAVKRAAPSFWRTSVEYPVQAGIAEYRVPDRALMSGIEKVVTVDANGLEHPLDEIADEERWRYSKGQRDPHWRGRFAYIMQAEHLRLVPTPTHSETSLTLKVYYHRQMSEMVPVAQAARIASAESTTRIDVTGGLGSGSSALQTTGSYVDLVRGAGMFGPIAVDRVIAAYEDLASQVIVLEADTPVVTADIAPGNNAGTRRDYVCLAGETVYTELPLDMWPVLVSAAAVAVLTATKDFAHADAERVVLASRMDSCRFLAEPRSDEPEMIMNRYSVLRRGRRNGMR
jgi:hypothetical protein